MKKEGTNGSKTACDKEKLKVECIERKYRISTPTITFFVSSEKELDENDTKDIIRKDVELKTFLENCQITDITHVRNNELVNITKEKSPTISIENIMTRKYRRSIRRYNNSSKDDDISKARYIEDIKNETVRRRELFDFLDLPERFVVKDYKKALAERGIITTNIAMPYDDLYFLERQGKIVRVEKSGGHIAFMVKKREIEIISE